MTRPRGDGCSIICGAPSEPTRRKCRVLMDLAGPKLRTGPLEPGPAVVKIKPSAMRSAV